MDLTATSLPAELSTVLRRQKYQMAGTYAAVKKCKWFHESLVGKRTCYKHKFFGIRSWRCIQMTPTALHCTQECQFCWRIRPSDLKLDFTETNMQVWDEPEEIVEGSIKAQRRILSGYKPHPNLDPERYWEAYYPAHVAISLAGEPLLYPEMSNLLEAYHRKGFTTFIVTNGTMPDALAALEVEPTQLYVSVCAPDKQTHAEICRPLIPDAWERLNKTLDLLSTLKCPTVMRLTLARNVNMIKPELYARLAERANPTYIEPKGYVHVGTSVERLKYENMPSHKEIREFASEIARRSTYNIIDDSSDSKVALMSRLERPIRLVE